MGKYRCKECGYEYTCETDVRFCEVLCRLKGTDWREKSIAKSDENLDLPSLEQCKIDRYLSKKAFEDRHGIKDADFRGYKNPYDDLMK